MAGAVAITTRARYEEIIRLHLKPALGDLPLKRLTPQVIQSYFSGKLASGLSPTTVRHHAMVLHEALHHAVRWGLLARNPCDMVDPPRRRPAEVRVWDDRRGEMTLFQSSTRGCRHLETSSSQSSTNFLTELRFAGKPTPTATVE